MTSRTIGTVVMHPCDAERARTVAAMFGARVALSENWPADKIGLRGVVLSEEQLQRLAELVPGWRVIRIEELGCGETDD